MSHKEKITIIGAGYVGISLAVLLAESHAVALLDIDAARVAAIGKGISPLAEADITTALKSGDLHLRALSPDMPDYDAAYADADFIIIATPTDYDVANGQFNTSAVDSVVAKAWACNQRAPIIIKSTIPVGHCQNLRAKHKGVSLLFAPEFLREGQALHDNLHPSRIIIGVEGADAPHAKNFAALLQAAAAKPDVETLFMGLDEAEAVKLFANTHLAMRVSFFNELDSYALARGLDAAAIIRGVSLDSRIGDYYNNPSFGYGGYCLPKDTRALVANYEAIPQDLMGAILRANETRKAFIAEKILAQLKQINGKTIGIYRLAMKSGSDNARASAVLGVIEILRGESDADILIYEPLIAATPSLATPSLATPKGCALVADLAAFKARADVIVANRLDDALLDVRDKVFTRDSFGSD